MNQLILDNGMKLCMRCMTQYDASLTQCPHCSHANDVSAVVGTHMPSGTLFHNRYVLGLAIGSGTYGITYIAWDKSMRRKVAIKEYFPNDYATRMSDRLDVIVSENDREKYTQGLKRFHDEAQRLAALGHIDGVVYIYDSFEENNTAYIVMEYLEGETLASYMTRLGIPLDYEQVSDKKKKKLKKHPHISEEEALNIMLPVLQALDSIHEKGILHRFISPDSIFLSRDYKGVLKVKLIEFQAARQSSSGHSKSLTVMLNEGYSPEEQYESTREQDTFTDVYSIGAVMYHLVTGVRPAQASKRRTAIEHNKRDPLFEPHIYNKELSENFEIAVLNAINVKPADRTPTAEEFVSELLSPKTVKRRGQNIKKIDFMKWPLWAKVTVPTGVALAIALLVFMGIRVLDPASSIDMYGKVRVSDFYGESIESAENIATEKGLLPDIGDYIYIKDMTPGLVCDQSISPGYIANINTPISFDISAEKEEYSMPNVVGMSISMAKNSLECMDLNIVTRPANKSGIAEGCVISQDRAVFDRIESGDKVVLTVSSGDTDVPEELKGNSQGSYVGMKYNEALSAAGDRGEKLVVVERTFSKSISRDMVLSQKKLSDDVIGIEVTEEWQSFKMPNLNGKEKDKGRHLLRNIGIRPRINEEISETRKKGNIFKQSVKRGEVVEPEDEVLISVSKGSAPFAMPDVIGMSEEEAIAKLRECGLVALSQYDYNESVQIGSVISQSVDPNGEVTRGEEIIIIVCTDEETVEIINVEGLSYKEAESKLKGLGLIVKKNEVYDNETEENIVIVQDPYKGARVKKGSEIILTVSMGISPERKKEIEKEEEEKREEAKKVLVELDVNGGDCSIGNITVVRGETYNNLPTPTREGYEFLGWFTSTDGGTEVTNSMQVSTTGSSQVLYASWKQLAEILSFDANGGITPVTSKAVPIGEKYGELPVPTKDYCTFDGWYTNANGGTRVDSNYEMEKTGATLYAHWIDNPESDWTLVASVPSDAKVIEDKWTYVETSWIESADWKVNGYSLDDSKTKVTRNEYWGNWSDWQQNPIERSSVRKVETRKVNEYDGSVPVSYDMVEYNYMSNSGKRYYRNTSIDGNYSGNGFAKSYGEFNRRMTIAADDLNRASTVGSGGHMGGSNAGYNDCGETGYILRYQDKGELIFFIEHTNYEDRYRDVTYYRCQDLIVEEIYTYYLYRDEEKESYTEVQERENISHIQHYVKYIKK